MSCRATARPSSGTASSLPMPVGPRCRTSASSPNSIRRRWPSWRRIYAPIWRHKDQTPVTRIDRYVIEKTMVPLAATIGIALVALLMERMVRLMEILVSQGGPLFLVLKMLGNLVPHYLGLALPAALFVGVMLATTRLSIDSEIDALQSVGVSLRRLLRPLMVLTLAIGVVLFLLYG